ncbi:MAG: BTAD domain-containing putative transcriptional regulator [Actinomycetota bacterium]|nr:BTAD domain-containing putative transcriptional regulator [Actinomycetota bacterium]MDK1017531.1 BTAD domain-containing putative transcriptional regulator [Actinomycetota bacterium]MDK1027375.1 BTAD domain-containing putative transcriptional regulator [Actinomycetota bacterium]MDK1039509.1 BTAD domain-containing putative transcriptional regulator [Actinomycetota bacterium]
MQSEIADIIRFLGPFEMVVDGQHVDLGGPKQRALLAYLVLHVGEPVSIARLVEAVWGDGAPKGAIRSLRTYASNLRRLAGSTVDVRGAQGTYCLRLRSIETDVDRFRRAVANANEVEDPHEISAILESALDLWRGPFLADVDRPWVQDESSILELERQRAVARWAEATIAEGGSDRVIPVVERSVSEAPLDERLSGLLMRALYRSGRQADALAVYRRLRTRLTEELGVQPGPELQKLEEQILLHEVSMDGVEPRWLLPAPASDLVGRSVEIEDLLARTEQVRLLTLTGPGGVGKTRLAIEVGRRIIEVGDQPVFFADLSSVLDESAVDAVLASSAGVQPHPDTGPLVGLIEYLRPRKAVLIVDNCEHLAGTVARSLAALVRGCPQLVVVATSRSPLYVDGELEWRTPSLALPDRSGASIGDLRRWPAVELLLQRAPNAFQVTDANVGDVVELCRSLDGLPLALELAASRLGSMTPAEILATLGSRVQLSRGDSPDESRHATLGATIDWSYELLPEEPRKLLIRLGVMSGEFLFEDVLAVCSPQAESPDDVRHQLSTLVDQSLVMAETSGTRTRYRLLETIRRFAIVHLGEDEPDVRTRHTRHFAELAEVEAARLLTSEEGDAILKLSSVHDNLRGAISWAMETGDMDSASQIVASLPDGGYWRSRNELVRWAGWVWEHTTPSDPRWRAVCGSAARGAWMDGRFDDALRFASAPGVEIGTVIAQCSHPDDVIADIALYRGDAQTALEHYSQVAEEANESGDLTREVWATYYVAVTNTVLGRATEAADAATRALSGARETGNPTALAFSLYANGLVVKHRMPAEAIAMFEEAVRMADSVRNDWFCGIARMELASVKVSHGDPDGGFRDFAGVVDHWHRAGDDTQLRHTWRYLVRALNDVGLHEEAAVLTGALLADTRSTLTHPNTQVRKDLAEVLGKAQYTRLTVRGSIMSVPELVIVSLDAIDLVRARDEALRND